MEMKLFQQNSIKIKRLSVRSGSDNSLYDHHPTFSTMSRGSKRESQQLSQLQGNNIKERLVWAYHTAVTLVQRKKQLPLSSLQQIIGINQKANICVRSGGGEKWGYNPNYKEGLEILPNRTNCNVVKQSNVTVISPLENFCQMHFSQHVLKSMIHNSWI